MKSLFPIVKNISAKTLGDDLIGIRPGESWTNAIERYILEERRKKIEKVLERIKGSD